MKIYDISVPIQPGMPIWPGDPPVRLEKISEITEGENANITQLQMCVHTGTHIDAPNHFFTDGKTLDQFSLDPFFGEVLIMEIESEVDLISAELLASHSQVDKLKVFDRVIFKTRNSKLWQLHPKSFQRNYVGLDTSGAEFLAELNLKLIGLDYLSIASYQDTLHPHQILLSQDILLLEGLNLTDIPPGQYQLCCAPLLIADCEGAPTRAFLLP